MMGYYGGGMGLGSLFGLVTWIALLAFLILGAMYFWKELHRRK